MNMIDIIKFCFNMNIWNMPVNQEEDYDDIDHPIWNSTDLNDIPKLGRVIGDEYGGEDRAKFIIHDNIIKVARSHPDFQATIREEELEGRLVPSLESKSWTGVSPTTVEAERQERANLRKQRRDRYNELLLSWFKTQKQLGNIGNEYNETIKYIQNEMM